MGYGQNDLDGAAAVVAVLQQDQYRPTEARPSTRPDAGADAARAEIRDTTHDSGHSHHGRRAPLRDRWLREGRLGRERSRGWGGRATARASHRERPVG